MCLQPNWYSHEVTHNSFLIETKVDGQLLESIPSMSRTCILFPSLKPKFKDKRHCEMFVKLATVMKSSNSRFKDQLWLQDNTVNKHCFLHVTLDMFFKCPYRPVSNTFISQTFVFPIFYISFFQPWSCDKEQRGNLAVMFFSRGIPKWCQPSQQEIRIRMEYHCDFFWRQVSSVPAN